MSMIYMLMIMVILRQQINSVFMKLINLFMSSLVNSLSVINLFLSEMRSLILYC